MLQETSTLGASLHQSLPCTWATRARDPALSRRHGLVPGLWKSRGWEGSATNRGMSSSRLLQHLPAFKQAFLPAARDLPIHPRGSRLTGVISVTFPRPREWLLHTEHLLRAAGARCSAWPAPFPAQPAGQPYRPRGAPRPVPPGQLI